MNLLKTEKKKDCSGEDILSKDTQNLQFVIGSEGSSGHGCICYYKEKIIKEQTIIIIIVRTAF